MLTADVRVVGSKLHHYHARDGASRDRDSFRTHPSSALSLGHSSAHRRTQRPRQERICLGPPEAVSISFASSKFTKEGRWYQRNVLLRRGLDVEGARQMFVFRRVLRVESYFLSSDSMLFLLIPQSPSLPLTLLRQDDTRITLPFGF